MNKVQIGFKINERMLGRLDRVCSLKGKSRTAIMNDLIENYLLNHLNQIEEKKSKFDALDRVLEAA